jgi:subtilisin family serine protease
VTLVGRGFFPAQAVTEASGEAVVTLYDPEFALDDIAAIYVQPRSDYWESFVRRPVLDASETNVVKLDRLVTEAAGREGQTAGAWGLRAMGLDRVSDRLTGKGVKIALIDSGCDNDHPATPIATMRNRPSVRLNVSATFAMSSRNESTRATSAGHVGSVSRASRNAPFPTTVRLAAPAS